MFDQFQSLSLKSVVSNNVQRKGTVVPFQGIEDNFNQSPIHFCGNRRFRNEQKASMHLACLDSCKQNQNQLVMRAVLLWPKKQKRLG